MFKSKIDDLKVEAIGAIVIGIILKLTGEVLISTGEEALSLMGLFLLGIGVCCLLWALFKLGKRNAYQRISKRLEIIRKGPIGNRFVAWEDGVSVELVDKDIDSYIIKIS